MRSLTFFGLLALLISSVLVAPGLAEGNSSGNDGIASSGAIIVTQPLEKSPRSLNQIQSFFSRWLEVQTFTLSTEYRNYGNSQGERVASQMLQRDFFAGRVKLDSKGLYSINGLVSTGTGFVSSWTTTGIGTGNLTTNHYLKQLFFAAKPTKWLEFQSGGLGIQRGESSEITTYDNDGYLMGQRVILRKPARLWFNEVSVTYAYLGDLQTPNVVRRFKRLDHSNYHQFLVGRKVGERAAFSADYTFQWGAETLRQGVSLKLPEIRLANTLRFENYQRLDVKPDYGWALTAEKMMGRKLSLVYGYADIDPNYGNLNGNRYFRGKRVHCLATYSIHPFFNFQTFYSRAFQNDFVVSNRNYLVFIVNFNAANILKSAAILP